MKVIQIITDAMPASCIDCPLQDGAKCLPLDKQTTHGSDCRRHDCPLVIGKIKRQPGWVGMNDCPYFDGYICENRHICPREKMEIERLKIDFQKGDGAFICPIDGKINSTCPKDNFHCAFCKERSNFRGL